MSAEMTGRDKRRVRLERFCRMYPIGSRTIYEAHSIGKALRDELEASQRDREALAEARRQLWDMACAAADAEGAVESSA